MANTPIRNTEPKCIYCGSKIIKLISDNSPIRTGKNTYRIHEEGLCSKCNKGYNWVEHFEYKGFSNLIEEN